MKFFNVALATILLSLTAASVDAAKEVTRGATPSKPALTVTSSAFTEGSVVPKLHTGDGKDLSPALSWSGAPAATKTFALTVEDPDAPGGTWFHWVIFNIPGSQKALPENVPKIPALKDGTGQGKNDFEKTGYNGPAPPKGAAHHYQFKLVALDAKLALPANCSKGDYYKAIKGHVLASGMLTGTYSRK